ncbi:MAG: 30S ribosomal protein S12 methylthiotransferase RimO [Chloroflexi bacterium]|jgi:ribosomal protein S12 methylthiotransferase|nr:30S ribosomal protein S12 methylthiotransferase RimO [Chloroflexota bacterium]
MRFYFTTLGCPKNSVDSEMMATLLQQAGHTRVEKPQRADVLLVNTCGFIGPAREESFGVLRELAVRKRRGQWLVAAGCMAQRYGDALRQQVPGLDAVIGTQSWPEIAALFEKLAARKSGQSAYTLVRTEGNLVASVARRAETGGSAYLKIADGCDAACAFCAIPLIKGRQQSKTQDEILREARELAEQQVREIILIAQDTTAYGRDRGERDALPGLLRALAAAAPSVNWLRVLYAYPQHISREMVEAMAELPAVCHYLDIPLQHGHPEVLRRMRRPHNLEDVYRVIAILREAMPDIALRSTFIVGYPGETEEEFEGLLAFMREVAFDKVGVFAYSPEEGTAAIELPDHVAPEVIAERYEQAMLVQQEISRQRNEQQVGRKLDVLIEGVGEGLSVGRTYREAPEIDGMVLIPGEAEVGSLVPARIVAAQEYDLIAEFLPQDAQTADQKASDMRVL